MADCWRDKPLFVEIERCREHLAGWPLSFRAETA
jgi:hypothetical protein